MKSKKLILAIIAIIAVVALLFVFIPSLRGIFGGGTSGEDDRVQKIVDAARAEEDSVFHVFIDNDAARFFTPKNDPAYFDDFFVMLDSAKTTPVRVTYYGDSQIEIDRFSCTLRETLQSRFGGGGIGYVPFKNVGTYTSTTSVSPVPATTHAYGTPDMKGSGDNYGMAAMASPLGGGVTLRVSTTKAEAYAHSHDFTRFTVMGRGNFSISACGKTASVSSPGKASRATVVFPATTEAAVSVSGSGTLYGVLVDGDNGVAVDNIPMRGCSGTIFRTINADNLREHYSACNVGLIIMQYGGNVMPYIKEGQSLENYAANLGKQIAYLHEISPKSKILFVGPSDMATRKSGAWVTYPVLPQVVEAIKKVANENDAAYWDIYGVMGGQNSMSKWVSENLAGPDRIHFTKKGAEKVAQRLSDALMHYYDYYKWRTSPIDVDKYLRADSIRQAEAAALKPQK